MNKSDVIAMAGAIQSISITKDDGEVIFCNVEDYAAAAMVDEEVADDLIEEALGMLVEEGVYEQEEGTYYQIDEREEWKAREMEEIEDWKQSRIDEMQAYDMCVLGA